mmetsp:Transcript_41011/g.114675  ORF Transcript_41011/g.114675 Transcript_41011/m.114675 type:complete len:211 (+) Transcript_41011:243-875(+)
MDNEYLVWRRFGHGASANVYANTNAGAHVDVDDLACAHFGTDDGNHDHCSPDAGTHVDYLTCARTVANHDHCGADAGTHLDVQLQRGALRRRLALPIGVWLVRPLRRSLQCAVDLESSGLLWRRVHHRAARVHVLLQCVDVRAKQPDAGTISGCWRQRHRGVVHAGRFRRLLSEHQQCGLHGGELLHARRAGAGGFGIPQLCQFGRRRGG